MGPSPGVFAVASVRRKLRQSPRNEVSFKRVGIKQPILSVRESRRRRLVNMSVDENEEINTELAMDTSMATIENEAEGI